MLFKGYKCLNVHLKLVQKFSNFLSSLYRAFEIFGSFLGQYQIDDISFINFLIELITSKLISWVFPNGYLGNIMFAICGNHWEYIGSKYMVLGHPVILYSQFWDLSTIIHFLAN